jgi:AraC-like DNA-binding protein
MHIPGPPLDRFVAGFWYYEGLDVPYERERVLPDGTAALMVNLSHEPRALFDRESPDRKVDFRRAWVSGTQSDYLVIDARRGSSMVGVRFKPGGLAPFLPMPASELHNRVLELDGLLGAIAGDLRDALLEAETPSGKFRVLEAFLRKRSEGRSERSAALAYAIGRLAEVPHLQTIDGLARELGMNHKYFLGRFAAEVGMTPKRFCRIRRFQQILRQIERHARVDWADLACACGYYDQAHFVHEFRAFSGLNPSAYVRQRGDDRNHVPILEASSGN